MEDTFLRSLEKDVDDEWESLQELERRLKNTDDENERMELEVEVENQRDAWRAAKDALDEYLEDYDYGPPDPELSGGDPGGFPQGYGDRQGGWC